MLEFQIIFIIKKLTDLCQKNVKKTTRKVEPYPKMEFFA